MSNGWAREKGNPVYIAEEWMLNDIDVTNGDTYYGYESKKGYWYMKKMTESAGDFVIRHATIKNNRQVEGYSEAWGSRDSLTYGVSDEAFD